MIQRLKNILIFWMAGSISLLAQTYPGTGSTPPRTADSTSLADFLEPDTFNFTYFYQDNIGVEYAFKDTLLNNNFQQYDPIREGKLDYANLGYLGSAHHQLTYQPLFRQGFDIGFHQFDLYKFQSATLPFYRLDKAFTNVWFLNGTAKQDGYFKGQFSRNFAKGLNFSIDYKKISSTGSYKSQRAINTALVTGFWYHDKGGKYDAFITYLFNSNEHQDNGGINDTLLTVDNTEREFNFPVKLSDAYTYHEEREYMFTHHYNLLGKPDSLKSEGPKRAFTLSQNFKWSNNRYQFYDENPDSSFYGILQTDNRGLRHFVRYRKLETSFWISTSKANEGGHSQRDLFKAGLIYKKHIVEQEPVDSNLNNLFVTGQWNFAPSRLLSVKTSAHFGLWDNAGDYRINGNLLFDFKNAGYLNINASNQLYMPTLMQFRMFISQQPLWENNFDKTLETNLAVTYGIPKLRFEVSGQYHLLNNYIYFDTLAFPQQQGLPISIAQLIIDQNFKVGNFHLDNSIVLQAVSEDQIRLPSFYSKHSLYFEGKIFKKVMLLRTGFDVRLNSNLFEEYYHPLVGQFQLQDKEEVLFYPAVDVFLTFKVKTFRFFIKGENLTHLVYDQYQQLFIQIPTYPQPFFNLRLGLSWQFLN